MYSAAWRRSMTDQMGRVAFRLEAQGSAFPVQRGSEAGSGSARLVVDRRLVLGVQDEGVFGLVGGEQPFEVEGGGGSHGLPSPCQMVQPSARVLYCFRKRKEGQASAAADRTSTWPRQRSASRRSK